MQYRDVELFTRSTNEHPEIDKCKGIITDADIEIDEYSQMQTQKHRRSVRDINNNTLSLLAVGVSQDFP